MGSVVAFPLKENNHVQSYLKVLNENKRRTSDFMALLNAVESLENLLMQSDKNMAEMASQLAELKEIQKHPIKAELNNISAAMKENTETAKNWLVNLKNSIVNGCKKILENFKDAGVSALDKVASFLKLKEGLEAISNKAAENNALCGKAINKIEAFSSEYHKGGRSLKNMGLIIIGKEPIDAVKENGKLSKAFSTPFRAAKTLWAKIERKAFVAARGLGDFHTRTQIKRDDKREAKEAKKADKDIKANTSEKTDIFKAVDKHKESVESNKKDKTHEKKKSNDER